MKVIYWLLIAVISASIIYWILLNDKPKPSQDIVVGQSLIVGIQGPNLDAANISFLETVKPGGIVLYKYNTGSEYETRKFIEELQAIAMRTIGVPYFIMIDEEPGGASRLGLFKGTAGSSGPNWQVVERDANKLRDLGINVILAPLADLEFGSKSFIGHRMLIHTPEELVDFNSRFISILAKNGIMTTLKHFPGLGLVKDDTHVEIMRTQASTTTIAESIGIFRGGIVAGASLVMTNHAIYESLDPTRSASISKKVLDILRNVIKFKGLIITDDITNMPVGNPRQILRLNDIAIETLRAGHNMVIFGSRRNSTLETYNHLLEIYRDDISMRKIFEINYDLILKYKVAVF